MHIALTIVGFVSKSIKKLFLNLVININSIVLFTTYGSSKNYACDILIMLMLKLFVFS